MPRDAEVCQAGKVSQEKWSMNQDLGVPASEVEHVSLAQEYGLKE